MNNQLINITRVTSETQPCWQLMLTMPDGRTYSLWLGEFEWWKGGRYSEQELFLQMFFRQVTVGYKGAFHECYFKTQADAKKYAVRMADILEEIYDQKFDVLVNGKKVSKSS